MFEIGSWSLTNWFVAFIALTYLFVSTVFLYHLLLSSLLGMFDQLVEQRLAKLFEEDGLTVLRARKLEIGQFQIYCKESEIDGVDYELVVASLDNSVSDLIFSITEPEE